MACSQNFTHCLITRRYVITNCCLLKINIVKTIEEGVGFNAYVTCFGNFQQYISKVHCVVASLSRVKCISRTVSEVLRKGF